MHKVRIACSPDGSAKEDNTIMVYIILQYLSESPLP
jgi:hypothetical protein